MLESEFQSKLIKQLESIFKGCVVLKNDANHVQGFPDLLVLYKKQWAALECKTSRTAYRQPNQEYYIDMLDGMSFASFIYPENKEQVLHELQRTFESQRQTRFSKS
jgi:hypothetical protein